MCSFECGGSGRPGGSQRAARISPLPKAEDGPEFQGTPNGRAQNAESMLVASELGVESRPVGVERDRLADMVHDHEQDTDGEILLQEAIADAIRRRAAAEREEEEERPTQKGKNELPHAAQRSAQAGNPEPSEYGAPQMRPPSSPTQSTQNRFRSEPYSHHQGEYNSDHVHGSAQRSARSSSVRPGSHDCVLHQRRGGDPSPYVVAQRNARASSACRSPQDFAPRRPDSPELVSDTPYHRGPSAMRIRAELHDEIQVRTVVIMREEVHAWAASECDAMGAIIRDEYQEA